MNKKNETRRYKWSRAATNLLVSIWCHDLIQKQLKISSRNQPIWASIARYMSRKGFEVTGTQCRTRIKNMLCSYHEAVKKKDRNCIEPYYDIFKKVLSNKKQIKKDTRLLKFKETIYPEKIVGGNEVNLECDDSNVDFQNQLISQDQVQTLEVKNLEPQSKVLFNTALVQELGKIIMEATDLQTNAIVNAIKVQNQIIEKLVVSEGQKLESIMAAERESRRQLEIKFDKLLSRLEANSLSQMSLLRCLVEAKASK